MKGSAAGVHKVPAGATDSAGASRHGYPRASRKDFWSLIQALGQCLHGRCRPGWAPGLLPQKQLAAGSGMPYISSPARGAPPDLTPQHAQARCRASHREASEVRGARGRTSDR